MSEVSVLASTNERHTKQSGNNSSGFLKFKSGRKIRVKELSGIFKNKKIIIFAPLVLIIGIFLLWGILYLAEGKSEISDVQITNITGTSVTVTWLTDKPRKGSILYSTSNAWNPILASIGKLRAYDDRDIEEVEYGRYELKEWGKYYVHHVTLRDLEPNTKYYYRISTGVRAASFDYPSVETAGVFEDLQEPYAAYGRTFDYQGNLHGDAIIYMKMSNYKGGNSQVLSTVTNDQSGWSIDIGTVRTASLDKSFDRNAANILVDIVAHEVKLVDLEVDATKLQPVSDIFLEKTLTTEDIEASRPSKYLGDLIDPVYAQGDCTGYENAGNGTGNACNQDTCDVWHCDTSTTPPQWTGPVGNCTDLCYGQPCYSGCSGGGGGGDGGGGSGGSGGNGNCAQDTHTGNIAGYSCDNGVLFDENGTESNKQKWCGSGCPVTVDSGDGCCPNSGDSICRCEEGTGGGGNQGGDGGCSGDCTGCMECCDGSGSFFTDWCGAGQYCINIDNDPNGHEELCTCSAHDVGSCSCVNCESDGNNCIHKGHKQNDICETGVLPIEGPDCTGCMDGCDGSGDFFDDWCGAGKYCIDKDSDGKEELYSCSAHNVSACTLIDACEEVGKVCNRNGHKQNDSCTGETAGNGDKDCSGCIDDCDWTGSYFTDWCGAGTYCIDEDNDGYKELCQCSSWKPDNPSEGCTCGTCESSSGVYECKSGGHKKNDACIAGQEGGQEEPEPVSDDDCPYGIYERSDLPSACSQVPERIANTVCKRNDLEGGRKRWHEDGEGRIIIENCCQFGQEVEEDRCIGESCDYGWYGGGIPTNCNFLPVCIKERDCAHKELRNAEQTVCRADDGVSIYSCCGENEVIDDNDTCVIRGFDCAYSPLGEGAQSGVSRDGSKYGCREEKHLVEVSEGVFRCEKTIYWFNKSDGSWTREDMFSENCPPPLANPTDFRYECKASWFDDVPTCERVDLPGSEIPVDNDDIAWIDSFNAGGTFKFAYCDIPEDDKELLLELQSELQQYSFFNNITKSVSFKFVDLATTDYCGSERRAAACIQPSGNKGFVDDDLFTSIWGFDRGATNRERYKTVFMHELVHKVDYEILEVGNPNARNNILRSLGWVQEGDPRVISSDSYCDGCGYEEPVRDYGYTNSKEDLATIVEAYYSSKFPRSSFCGSSLRNRPLRCRIMRDIIFAGGFYKDCNLKGSTSYPTLSIDRFDSQYLAKDGLTWVDEGSLPAGVLGASSATGMRVTTYEDIEIDDPVDQNISSIDVDEEGQYEVTLGDHEYGSVDVTKDDEGNKKIVFYSDYNNNGQRDEGEDISVNGDEVRIKKVAEVVGYDMKEGWQLYAFPFVSDELGSASDLIKLVNDNGGYATHVSTYKDGKWRVYSQRRGVSFSDDYNITPGSGYFVRIHQPAKVIIRGNKFEESVPLYLIKGWNLVGVVSPGHDHTSSSLIDAIIEDGVGADTVTKWDSGKYQNFIKDAGLSYGDDFKIFETGGYFIRVKEDGGRVVL